MLNVRVDRPTQRRLAEEDHPAQTLRLDGEYESLGVGVAIGSLIGSPDYLHPGMLEREPKTSRELGVPVTDQEPVVGQEPIGGVGQIASDLGPMNDSPGLGVIPAR